MKINTPGGSDHHKLYETWTMARKLMDAHGLKKWKLEFSRSTSTAGWCSPDWKATIELSAPLMSVWNSTDAEDTILHEIAHALTPGHHHDRAWKAKAREIGARPERCYRLNEDTAQLFKWKGICPNGHKTYKNRKPVGGSCGRCSKKYSPDYIIAWEVNRVDD